MFRRVLLLIAGGLLTLRSAGSESVLCYGDSDEDPGSCSSYLGEGVSEEDCCLNIKYSFRRDAQGPCQACRPAQWTEWGAWSACSVSCKEGIRSRRRSCIGQGDCNGSNLEVQACSLQDCCPEDGEWSPWSPWSSCSVSCESGTMERSRECNNPPPLCGGTCGGQKKETAVCNTRQICPTHGSWGNWGPWGSCSSPCIREGSGDVATQERQRECNSPPPSTIPRGRPCTGDQGQSQECKGLPSCPVDGGWSEWRVVSECSVTCGVGQNKEERVCDNPPPRHGGKDCAGSPTRHTLCNTKIVCPIDGQWSEWQEWTECSRLTEKISCTKRAGVQNRRRECQGVVSSGKWCEGPYRESRHCYNVKGCILKSQWSEWSEWGLCSSPCGRSERTRARVCEPIYPEYPDFVDTATKSVEVFFSGSPRIKCPAIDGQTLKVEEKKECQNVPEC
ncbi:properdin [Spea bombifrons]|uniref:properdin n=1 Tax=Spea bombifrons TaxID=233779 RepID=UPI00234903E5|nr:properdin [Spea bombifrons]